MVDRDHQLRALDWVNFFLADVQAGLGPFLGIYLINKEGGIRPTSDWS
jgi:hypothetical protein